MENLLKAMVVALVSLSGCTGSVAIHKSKVPETKVELEAYVAARVAQIEGIETELKEARVARDSAIRLAEKAEGWYQKDNARQHLNRANHRVEFTATRLTWAKEDLAKAKSRLLKFDKPSGAEPPD